MGAEYSDRFYATREEQAVLSADQVVPIILSYLQPRSVVDIGCGSGSWTHAFARHGVPEVIGVDGPWATNFNRNAPFCAYDFGAEPTPFRPALPRESYDLALSLEFAEHVAPERADAVVDLLTSLAPVVVFSAAAPQQGGTGHVNEQWPAYWAEKFQARGFEACDFIRPLIWTNDKVRSWYRQNILVFFRDGVPASLKARVAEEAVARLSAPPPLIHPEMFAMHLYMAEQAAAANPLRRAARKAKRLLRLA